MFGTNEKEVLGTIKQIDEKIKTHTGGYLRYENDGYVGGKNPWPLSNLWMALYNLENGDTNKAIQNFDFVVNSSLESGLLGEQVDNETLQPIWVIGLAWSHSMFLIVLEKLIKYLK